MFNNFCPNCGFKFTKKNNQNSLTCTNCDHTVYLNSKPTASVLIINDDQLLLGKRRVYPSKGKWDVIGGFLDFGEHPADGAKREAKEETGLDIDTYAMLGFFMDTYGPTKDSTLNICFLGKIIGGQQTPGDDIEELRWFRHKEIPSEIAFQNGRDMINAWLKSIS